jgi:carboxymethylenebutenolidase
MSKWGLFFLMIAMVAISGCAQKENSEGNMADGGEEDELVRWDVNVSSGNATYPAYLAAPSEEGEWPGVVMIHSFNGLEPGYLTLADRLAAKGYVVIAPKWQAFSRTPSDETVGGLIENCSAFLKDRDDVVAERLGLTGFCAGGRYTMLFLPQMNETFGSGVAWYGFPYSGGFLNQSRPSEYISWLRNPMLIIHGTNDVPSPISDIFRYAEELDASGRYFEMKVYQGEPHGFMIEGGQLSESFAAEDAFYQMESFFDRTLKDI